MKKSKHFLSATAVIFFLIIAYGSDDNKEINTDNISKISDKNSGSELPLKTRLENNIKSFEGNTELATDLKTLDGIIIVLALYKSYFAIIKEGKESTVKEENELASKLEQKVSNSQVKNFPILRLSYFKIMKEKLWENDVDVTVGGKKNTILNLTAGYFAANRNIKSTQETLHEMLVNLRFKQINYRWYKGDDEYTYYTIESPKDSEVIE